MKYVVQYTFTNNVVDTSFLVDRDQGMIVHQDNTNSSIRNTQ